MNIVVVVGNPKPRSRTHQVAMAVAERLSRATGAEVTLSVDLVDYASQLFEWPNPAVTRIAEAVASSDFLVVASPTYKATYTGLLKAFLDRYANNGLSTVIAIPVMTVSTSEHAMAVEVHLRPLLVELGASVPTRGLAFPTPQFDDLDLIVTRWADDNLNSRCFMPALEPVQVK